jgi:hypothetical protein
MKTLIITESLKKKFKLPAKSLGEWGVENVSEESITLHRVKSDGTLGSNRSGNILKISTSIFMDLAYQAETKVYGDNSVNSDITEELSPDLETRISKMFNIGTRKIKWLVQLVNAMNSEPLTQKFIQEMGELKFIGKVLDDTNSGRTGGKAYSSISSALKVWNNRAMKGDI